ncbi:SNF2-related protein [Flagellimonas pacifica]|uniref:Adenine-specific DNA methylase, N12 class n=1 Tax=Flagellimonas pacifica TaxID=1247520 RepID=A0A285MY15_9FLAO|nr:SNF2-related protein [Allomuricauda parva]SNZ01437.1 Adenine-specific DNA methylase, N12 class [Allomuricauda parva]
MKYSKKKYLDYMVRTIDALMATDSTPHVFINNPGFGNIFDILKNDSYRNRLTEKLIEYGDADYAQTIMSSLKKGSLNSFYTPDPVVNSITAYIKDLDGFDPKTILEPSAGNGLFIRALSKSFPSSKFTAFEKEILTVRILEHNFKFNDNVKIYGIPFENIAQTDATKRYDLVVSNIPFGANKIFDTQLQDHPLQSQISKNIHSYFIHKSLASLKPSGVSVLICTKNFMDKSKYAQIREDVMNTNNFVGGLRLPDSTFAQENTAVVTDILVFQNNAHIKPSQDQEKSNALFMGSSEKQLGDNFVQISDYFSAYPNRVMGELVEGGLYDNRDYTVKSAMNIDMLSSEINEGLRGFKIAPNLQKTKAVAITEPIQKPLAQAQIPAPKPLKNEFGKLRPGNLFIKQQKLYKINGDNALEPIRVKPKEFDRLSKILALRDTYFKLLEGADDNSDKIRDELDYQYDAFDFQYGQLHDKANYPFVTLDIQGPMLLGLETPKDGAFIKSDVFHAPQITKGLPEPKVEATKLLSLEDAIYYSLNRYNRIDLGSLKENTGKLPEEIIKESLDRQLLFLNPEEKGWELSPKFLFLSGTIYEKLNAYRKNDFGQYQPYVDKSYIDKSMLSLEKVRPPMTPFEDLDVKLHEPWFPIEFTQAFIYDTYRSLVHIAYNDSTSKYMVKIEKADYEYIKKFSVQTEHRYYYFSDILEGALNSTIPYVSKGSKERKRTDKAKMQEIRIKFDLLYKEFHTYIVGKPQIKERLERIFYNTYDAQVHPKYDGDYLQFEGLRHFTPYKSQKDTVAGIIINQGLLVNKEVGFGKTLDIALTTQKLKELELSRKTLVIGLRSTVIQLERELLNAFPTMKLLVAHDKVVKGLAKRNAFFKKISTNPYDVVLMSHDTFKFIPQSPEVIQEIIREELENLERDLSVIHTDKYNINKRVLKGLEQRKENLEVSLQQVYFQIKRGQSDIVNFDQMGFEHIMVDESHKFKNLMYTTRHNRVAGLNTDKGSERSKNLLVAMRTLQKAKTKDFQTTFLSGTPISNSITEVYVLFKYLIPHRMEQMNITSFDQWAQVFANKSYEFEPTVSGDYKVRERFRSFKKMKLLSSLYNEISIIVNGTTHQIDRPKMQLDVHTLKPTPAQLEYFEQIKEFLRTGDSSLLYGAKHYTEEQKSALSLIALHHMRNASIDPRLLNGELADPGDAKLRTIASEVYATYKQTEPFKGTQAIFSDLGVPKDSFNIYGELKRILTEEYDIPMEEVVFIHDFRTDTKRLECFKKVNNGEYRVIIGSTEKLGTGTNIQERLVRIHHVDIPYRPTDIDQRNGRGVRKGNIGAKEHHDNEVVVSFYIVENCTDALMLNNVNIKKNFIEQLTNGTIQFNRLDMGPVNDEGSIDYKTLLAVAKNDPLYLEKEELAKQLDELQLERSIYKKNRLEAKNNISFYETELVRTSKNVTKLENDLPQWDTLSDKDSYYKALRGALNSPDASDALMLGEDLNTTLQAKKEEIGEHTIVTISNAKMVLKVEDIQHHQLLVVTPNASYGYGSKRIVSNWNSLADYMHNALSKIPKSLAAQQELVAEFKKTIKANQKVLELHFDKTEELELVEKRLVEINADLDEKYDAEPEEKEESKKVQSKALHETKSDQGITL